jgi:hypothetical protein
MHIRAHLGHDAALLPQCRHHGRPRLKPVQPLKWALGGDVSPLVQDVEAGQPVPPADLEVVRVVRRGHLDRPSTELRVHMRVSHHRDAPPGQRQPDLTADQVGIAGIVRMHGNRGVPQHGLRPRGGDDDRIVSVPVPDGDQLAVLVAVIDLDVRKRGEAARAPVDDPLRPVDETVVEEPLEDRLHGAGQALVHGEALTGPVHAVAEPAHLAEDLAPRLSLPLPDPLHELLAAQVMPAQPFLGQLTLHHVLGGDPRVVHPRQPQHRVPLHPAPPHQGIHQRVIQRMPDMQRPRHIRRRNNNAVRGRLRANVLRIGPEKPAGLPAVVAAWLYLAGRVLRRQLLLVFSTHVSRV